MLEETLQYYAIFSPRPRYKLSRVGRTLRLVNFERLSAFVVIYRDPYFSMTIRPVA
jgi:hypothetical protein